MFEMRTELETQGYAFILTATHTLVNPKHTTSADNAGLSRPLVQTPQTTTSIIRPVKTTVDFSLGPHRGRARRICCFANEERPPIPVSGYSGQRTGSLGPVSLSHSAHRRRSKLGCPPALPPPFGRCPLSGASGRKARPRESPGVGLGPDSCVRKPRG